MHIMFFFYTYILMMKFNCEIRYSKRLATITNNNIDEL